jgi:Flp pilus assembly protein TadD
MGQILSDEGDQEEAINSLIDALKWNSKNGYALTMMGNIFAKFKDDISTAMKYYDQALIANPKDNIPISNIGANLLQQGKLEEAKKYFWEAIKINDQYPNTHFALGMIAEKENDLQSAFFSTIQAIKLNKNKDVLYQNSVRQAFEIAMQGREGYNTRKKDYFIPSIPNKQFSGYHILAYYYVSWAIAIPAEVDKLGLDYAAEYAMALTMKTNN